MIQSLIFMTQKLMLQTQFILFCFINVSRTPFNIKQCSEVMKLFIYVCVIWC